MRAPAIARSGWWVAAAAVVLTIAVAAVMLAPLLEDRPRNRITASFDLSGLLVPRELVVAAMARDGVRVLSEPATVDPAEVDRRNREERGKLLVPDDRIVGVALGGQARAYPLRLMRWHEVVNDVVGGEPIAVTYSPLCDSVVVFSRDVGGQVVDLGVSGLLYNSNTLLYDRNIGPAASALWTQLDGRAVAGPDPENQSPLPLRVASLTTWAAWRRRHPETRVLEPQPDLGRIYRRDPYHSYFGSDLLRFPVAPLPPASDLRLKDRVVVITTENGEKVFALSHLAEAAGADAGEVEVEVAALELRLRFRLDPGVVEVESLAETDRPTAVRYAFWFAWYALGGTVPGVSKTGS
ncbi:MAG: DUF3179 domain-containing (seleno)protein [Thermoanaerobaculales bacterium]